jgi:hypothetical protein
MIGTTPTSNSSNTADHLHPTQAVLREHSASPKYADATEIRAVMVLPRKLKVHGTI